MKSRRAKMGTSIAGSGSTTFRATLPDVWIRDMGLSEDDRKLRLIYNEKTKKITIENAINVINMDIIYSYMYELCDKYKEDLTDEEMQTDEVIDNLTAVTVKEFKDEFIEFDLSEDDLKEKIVKHIKKHQEDI